MRIFKIYSLSDIEIYSHHSGCYIPRTQIITLPCLKRLIENVCGLSLGFVFLLITSIHMGH